MKLSKRLDQFPEYIFSRLAKRVAEVEKSSGRKVLSFGAGSPDFPPSKMYVDALKGFLDEPGSYLYPGYGAIPELTNALQTWHKNRFDVTLENNEVYPLLGSRDGVAHLPLALCDEGDEILVPDPGYPAFSGPALMIGAVPKYYSNLTDLMTKMNSNTKYIWINFPSNPTGQVAHLEELEPIVALAKKHNVWIIYDNAYSEITFGGFVAPSILQITGAKDIAIEIGSFSKMFSFAGFRMGWIVGNKEIIAALSKIKSQMDSGMMKPLQQLGAYALTHPDAAWHTAMIQSYEQRRDIIVANLKKIGLIARKTPGSLYLWVKIPESYADSESFAFELLAKKKILVTPGTAFGKNGTRYVRVSICVNIDRIGEYFV